MRSSVLLSVLATMVGCATSNPTNRPCHDLCEELVVTCSYAAFPSFSSCEQGCTYNDIELGADIDSELDCIQEAACDTFQIVECEHAHGAS